MGIYPVSRPGGSNSKAKQALPHAPSRGLVGRTHSPNSHAKFDAGSISALSTRGRQSVHYNSSARSRNRKVTLHMGPDVSCLRHCRNLRPQARRPLHSHCSRRLLGQGRGGQKTMCCWLQRWWSPSDGCSQRGPCSSSSTSHFAMLQEGDWEGHRALLGAEEMMLCSGCVGPCVPLWAKCPLYRLFHQPKGICLASQS